MHKHNERQAAEQAYLEQLHKLDAYVRKISDRLGELREQADIAGLKNVTQKLEIVNSFLDDETPMYLDGPIKREDVSRLQDESGFIRGIVAVNESELFESNDAIFDMLAERLYGSVLLTDTTYNILAAQDGTLYVKIEGIPDDLDLE